jgi:hypothetical protein
MEIYKGETKLHLAFSTAGKGLDEEGEDQRPASEAKFHEKVSKATSEV